MNGNNGYSGNDITPEILNYSELCTGNCRIEPQLYIEHKVNRGLRRWAAFQKQKHSRKEAA